MGNQIHMFGRIDPPPWPACFRSCEHFGGEEDDYFPGTKIRRCMYGIAQCGTGGGDCYQKQMPDGNIEMYCQFYEPK